MATSWACAASRDQARNQIPREISVRHQMFAMRAVWECVPGGIKALGVPGIVTAYIKTYNPRSYGGVRASASRLMRHPHVRAAMQWHYAKMRNEIHQAEQMPRTAKGIWLRLCELYQMAVGRLGRRLIIGRYDDPLSNCPDATGGAKAFFPSEGVTRQARAASSSTMSG
jgi:hypothetical protein